MWCSNVARGTGISFIVLLELEVRFMIKWSKVSFVACQHVFVSLCRDVVSCYQSRSKSSSCKDASFFDTFSLCIWGISNAERDPERVSKVSR